MTVLGLDHLDACREVLADVCQAMTIETFPPNAIIMKQGDPADECFVVIAGTCDIYKVADKAAPRSKEATMFVRPPVEDVVEFHTVEAPLYEAPKFNTLLDKVMRLTKAGAELRRQSNAHTELFARQPRRPSYLAATAEGAGSEDSAQTGTNGGLTTAATVLSLTGSQPSLAALPVSAQATPAPPAASPLAGGPRMRHKRLMAAVVHSGHPSTTALIDQRDRHMPQFVMPLERAQYGEQIATVEEGDVFGELALFREGTSRAATVISSGLYDMPAFGDPTVTRSHATMDLKDTVVVRVSRDCECDPACTRADDAR